MRKVYYKFSRPFFYGKIEMKIYVAEEFGAQNSKPVFRAFISGLHTNNVSIVSDYTDADVICIWSYLFSGRMAGNRLLHDYAKDNGIPLVVLSKAPFLVVHQRAQFLHGAVIHHEPRWSRCVLGLILDGPTGVVHRFQGN